MSKSLGNGVDPVELRSDWGRRLFVSGWPPSTSVKM